MNFSKKFSKNKGITLIALVVTIIVLLILAGISISMLTGQNGILNRAAEAKQNNDVAQGEEQVKLAVMAALTDGTGTLTIPNLKKELADYGITIAEDATFPVTVSAGGKSYTIASTGAVSAGGSSVDPTPTPDPVTPTGGQTISDLFDETGNVEGKLHIGDFVNYTPSNDTWTAEEITQINANGSNTSLPSSSYQFGGFAAGDSKSGNAKPYNSSYAYAKDSTGSAITGWRVFDVADGTVTLISAGCPEDYYHPNVTNGGYISEYILTGTKNSSGSSADYTGITPRDWSMYVNSSLGATKAGVLTKTGLDSWYTKYITNGTAADTYNDATSQKIYSTKYENLIDNYSYVWLASASTSLSNFLYLVDPYDGRVSYRYNYAFGVRVLVSLPSNIKLDSTSSGTKTVINRDSTQQNYAVWDFAK